MSGIRSVKKQTDNRFVNLYELEAVNKNGDTFPYYLASRERDAKTLKLSTGKNVPDGVVIYGVREGTTPEEDQIVLVRQYRYTIDDYIYELPAGLVEPGEDYREAAIREMHEETGLTLTLHDIDRRYERPFFTTIGMTDEACSTVYGTVEGDIRNQHLEASEEIQVVFADRKEAERILKEENVAIICAYRLIGFIHGQDAFSFLTGDQE